LNYYPKTAILPPCSIYRHGGHDGWSAGSSDITFKGNPLRDDSGQVWLKLAQWFQRRRFLKKFTDGRQMPIDGNSSYRWAKNCSVGRSWQAEHVCSLNLTSISYSFLNKGRKVLKFWNFDKKKKTITPKWVMGFT
jgi:hypothetical protein